MVRDYLKGDSKALGRPMEALWFGHAGRPVLMFPTSMGQFYELEDFGLMKKPYAFYDGVKPAAKDA